MMLAHDMGLEELRNDCEEHVVSTLTSENACTLLTTLMKMPEKIGKCFYFLLCLPFSLFRRRVGGMNDSFHIKALTGVNESPGVHSDYFVFEFLILLLNFHFSFSLILETQLVLGISVVKGNFIMSVAFILYVC